MIGLFIVCVEERINKGFFVLDKLNENVCFLGGQDESFYGFFSQRVSDLFYFQGGV